MSRILRMKAFAGGRRRRTQVFVLLASLLICRIPAAASDSAGLVEDQTQSPTVTLQEQQQSNPREIKVNEVVEATIGRGENQSYIVALKAGEYLHASLSNAQRLVVEVFDPTRAETAAICPTATGSTCDIWLVAVTTGKFHVRISAPNNKERYGSYSIVAKAIGELAIASISDQLHAKASDSLFRGIELVRRADEASRQRGIELLKTALDFWRQLKDRAGEALTLHELGAAYGAIADWAQAVNYYTQAVILWQQIDGHELEEATTLFNLASVNTALGKVAEAIDGFQKAIDLRRRFDDKRGVASALTNLGQVYINKGEFQSALDCHEEALRVRQEIEDVQGEALSLSNIAGVHFRRGEIQQALNYSLQALPLRRAAGDKRGEAITLTNIGVTYVELGEPQDALRYYEQALGMIQQLDPYARDDSQASILDAIGRSYYELEDNRKALDSYDKSIAFRRNKANPYGLAATLANEGSVYARIGDSEKAAAAFDQALQLQRSIGDRRGQMLTLQKIGELREQSGDLTKAREFFNGALELSRNIKNVASEANLLYALARIEKATGHTADARTDVERAIAIVENIRVSFNGPELRALFLSGKQDLYAFEIDLLMQAYLRDGDRQSLLNAIKLSEERRARSLLDTLNTARAAIRQQSSSKASLRERDLRARLSQAADRQIKILSGDRTQAQATQIAEEVQRLTTEYEQSLAELRMSDPRYAALIQSMPVSMTDLQSDYLDPDTVLLEYSLGAGRSYLWAVTSKDISGYQLPARSELESQARAAYGLLTARSHFIPREKQTDREARIEWSDSEFIEAATRLGQILLGPVASLIKGKKVVVVGEGALEYLPFAALASPIVDGSKPASQARTYRPLLLDCEITRLPSASILATLRRETAGRTPAPKTVALFADPVFSKNDVRVLGTVKARSGAHPKRLVQDQPGNQIFGPAVNDINRQDRLQLSRLPYTRREADVIMQFVRSPDAFKALDFDASRSTVVSSELSQFRIVHFATHGFLNDAHPNLSGLIFSLVDQRGNDRDGFLSVDEIFNLNLPADLIVLSGCRTALGKEIKGEGVLGLTRAFFYAGAARVAVSLWDVDDKSTSELMTRFYSGMLGNKKLSAGTALRDAQIAMWRTREWRAAYYWAGFVIQGEYR